MWMVCNFCLDLKNRLGSVLRTLELFQFHFCCIVVILIQGSRSLRYDHKHFLGLVVLCFVLWFWIVVWVSLFLLFFGLCSLKDFELLCLRFVIRRHINVWVWNKFLPLHKNVNFSQTLSIFCTLCFSCFSLACFFSWVGFFALIVLPIYVPGEF